jgi:hypothetical protein
VVEYLKKFEIKYLCDGLMQNSSTKGSVVTIFKGG